MSFGRSACASAAIQVKVRVFGSQIDASVGGGTAMIRKGTALAAAATAAASAPGGASAADLDRIGQAFEDVARTQISVEGGPVFSDGAPAGRGLQEYNDHEGKFGRVSNDVGDQDGWYAKLTLERQFAPNWDWRIAATVTRLAAAGKRWGPNEDGEAARLRSDLDFDTLDAEFGYRPGDAWPFGLRLFAGLRGLHAWDSLRYRYAEDGAEYQFRSSADTWGLGPRAGLDWLHRYRDSRFGFVGSVSGAALFASSDITTRRDQTGEEPFRNADDRGRTVFNLEGSFGAVWFISAESNLTLGYRAQKWWNIRNAQETDGGGNVIDARDDDVLVHGPFLKVDYRF